MNIATTLPAPPSDQMVTASDLVRHFGVWQERAIRAPVYVMHRGRPRLVLTSVDLMDALCTASDPAASDLPGVEPLLQAIREPVIVVDADLRVTAASRAATALLGPIAQPGTPLARAWPSPHDTIAQAAARVLAAGIAETMEVANAPRGGRRLALVIEPLGLGVVLAARDVTREDALAEAEAEAASLETAFRGSAAAAVARVNLRGYIVRPDAALAALTGVGVEALASTRLASLFDIASRVGVGDAVERALADASPQALDARLLVNRADPLAVRVALAPLRRGPAMEGVTVLIVRQPHG